MQTSVVVCCILSPNETPQLHARLGFDYHRTQKLRSNIVSSTNNVTTENIRWNTSFGWMSNRFKSSVQILQNSVSSVFLCQCFRVLIRHYGITYVPRSWTQSIRIKRSDTTEPTGELTVESMVVWMIDWVLHYWLSEGLRGGWPGGPSCKHHRAANCLTIMNREQKRIQKQISIIQYEHLYDRSFDIR